MGDPRGRFEFVEDRRAVVIGYARVDRGAPDVPVAEVILDELERKSGVQEVGGDGVPERVTGVTTRKASAVAVAREQRLDLSLLQGTAAAPEQRDARWGMSAKKSLQQLSRA